MCYRGAPLGRFHRQISDSAASRRAALLQPKPQGPLPWSWWSSLRLDSRGTRATSSAAAGFREWVSGPGEQRGSPSQSVLLDWSWPGQAGTVWDAAARQSGCRRRRPARPALPPGPLAPLAPLVRVPSSSLVSAQEASGWACNTLCSARPCSLRCTHSH